MKTRILAAAALGVGLVVVGVNCFPLAPAPCIVGRADAHRYAAKYTPKPGQTFDPSCRPAITAEFREDLWISKYFQRGVDLNKIALRPTRFTKNVEDGGTAKMAGVIDPANDPFAQGDFEGLTEVADPELSAAAGRDLTVCTVPTFNLARQDLPQAMGAPVPTSYQWSNMRFLSGAEFQGTMMGADVTITEGACVINYDVVAVWPGDVTCESDEDCADPKSTLNVSYDTFCMGVTDSAPGRCVPSKPFPSLREGSVAPQ